MSVRTTDTDVSRRRLIDRLVSAKAHGPLLGMLATTYEFQAEFFETDFLPTLLDLGAWDDRSWTSRVAVEWWPPGESIDRLSAVSPFWSEERGETGPLGQLLGHLRDSGLLRKGAEVRLLTEAKDLGEGRRVPVLPESYGALDLSGFGVVASALAVDPGVLPAEVEQAEGILVARPLHAKVLLFEGPTTSLLYLGSANFTNRAWGFLPPGAARNVEAGLVLRRTGKDRALLAALLPGTVGNPVELIGAAAAQIAQAPDREPQPPWPGFLRDVRLCAPVPSAGEPKASDERLVLEAVIEEAAVEGAWSLSLRGEDLPSEVLLNSTAAITNGKLIVEPAAAQLERLLRDQQVVVRWWVHEGSREFPINVSLEARERLPVAPGAGRPAESQLLAYYQGRIRFEDLFPEPLGGAGGGAEGSAAEQLSVVDTDRIQSYQLREFVEALKGVRDDLRAASKAAPSAMRLALRGAVSPVQLARAVDREVREGRRTPTAGSFQLFEIVCCLLEARGFEVSPLHAERWLTHVSEASALTESLLAGLLETQPELADKKSGFGRYEKAIRAHYRRTEESR